MPSIESLQWKKRSRHETNAAAQRQIWESVCGTFRVVKSQILYGRVAGCAYPDVFRSEQRVVPVDRPDLAGWIVVARHKSLAAAQRECQRQARLFRHSRREAAHA